MSAPRKKPGPSSKSTARGNARGKKTGGRWLGGCGVLLLLLAVPAAMAGWSWWKLGRPYQGYAGESKVVTVEPGMGAGAILERLQREGVLEDARLARFYLLYFLRNPPIQAGEYRFSGPMSMPSVLDKLVRGDVLRHSITLVEGLTLEETATQLANERFGDLDALLGLMRSPELIADIDPDAPDLEGYLFPETYSFVRGTSEREVVAKLVATFRERFAKEVQPILARRPGAPPVREVVTLASIVEKEAQVEPERPTIAAVYRNRLDRGIGLAADPTVIFALKRLGRWNGNIRRSDLALDSPYNTYRYAGLPPGPIASPGLASLKAAAAPEEVPYLYFVSRNDGTHVFSTTLQEHNRNVELWQRRFFRERRARERAGR